MSASFNLPDGLHPLDLPGNSHLADQIARSMESIYETTEEQLRERVEQPGEAREAFAEWLSDEYDMALLDAERVHAEMVAWWLHDIRQQQSKLWREWVERVTSEIIDSWL